MRRPPAHDDPSYRPRAAFARLARALIDPQMLLHRAVALGRGVVVDRAAAPFDRLRQNVAQGPMQPANVVGAKSVRIAQRVQPRPPQRLVGVDVADPGEEALVHQQRLEPAAAPGEQLREPPRGEVVGKRLRSGREDADGFALGRLAGLRVAAIQPHPPELAHVAKAQLATVGQGQHHVDMSVRWRFRRHDEELPGHLEVDREHRGLGGSLFRRPARRSEPQEQLLAAATDALDLASRHARRERLRLVAAQSRRPVGARADDPRARHQAAQVAGDRLDFRQLGHT